jgi:hypothetical protein
VTLVRKDARLLQDRDIFVRNDRITTQKADDAGDGVEMRDPYYSFWVRIPPAGLLLVMNPKALGPRRKDGRLGARSG